MDDGLVVHPPSRMTLLLGSAVRTIRLGPWARSTRRILRPVRDLPDAPLRRPSVGITLRLPKKERPCDFLLTPNDRSCYFLIMGKKLHETRERLLQQGLALMSRDGMAGVTLGQIAEQVGMSKSGVFAHFR